MFKKGAITQLYNACLADAGNDEKKAGQLLSSWVEKGFSTKKLVPSDFNFAQLAAELLPGYNDLDRNDMESITNSVRSSQFPILTKTILHGEIMSAYERYEENVGELISEGEATRTTKETMAGFTEAEGPELRLEGMSYEETNFGEKSVEVHMADFGKMISLTAEAIFNDRTGQLLDNARTIGEKGGQHRAKMIMETLECLPRTAFKEPTGGSKAFVYGGTAVQVADFYNATTHAGIDGRLNPNLKTSNGLLNYTNIKSALDLFTAMKDSQGDKIVVQPTHIIVPEALKVQAWQILNSASYVPVGQGASAAIDIRHVPNPFSNQGGLATFKLYASRYMSSDTTWYIGEPAKQLKWLWVFRPATASLASSADRAFTNKIVVTYKFSYHGGIAHKDYVNIVKNTQ
jgi:hypothetical protein